jgi:hypothetical protein
MLHYDDSTRDDWAVEWFDDKRCTNGYTWLVLDDGSVIELADPAMRTPHAGACREQNANSRFYGISAATNGLVPATPAQLAAIVTICIALFRFHRWTLDAPPSTIGSLDSRLSTLESLDSRLVGHDSQAVWNPAATRAAGMSDEKARPLWGTLGRKVDPTGVRPDGRKIIDVNQVRAAVAAALRDDGGNDAPR